MIEQFGCANLDEERASFLRQQLQYTHAKISIRVVDQHGVIRTWLDQSRRSFRSPTRV